MVGKADMAQGMHRRQALQAHHLTPELPREPGGNEVRGHAISYNTSCAATISEYPPAQPLTLSC